MNKLTSIRIKQEDGTYSEEYPVSVLAENVVWEQGQSNSLVDILGQVSFNTNGSIQHQIDVLDNKKFNTSDLNTYLAGQISTDVTSWLNTNVNPIGSAVTVDESLTISGSAADSKVVGDNIADLKNAFDSAPQIVLSSDGSGNVSPELTLYQVDGEDGYFNSSGFFAKRPTSDYKTFTYEILKDGNVYLEPETTFLNLLIYNDESSFDVSNRVYFANQSALPTADTPVSVSAGNIIAISRACQSIRPRAFTVYVPNPEKILSENVLLNNTQIEQVQDAIKESAKLQKCIYRAVTAQQDNQIYYSDKARNVLSIFFPAKDGYIQYNIGKCEANTQETGGFSVTRMCVLYAANDDFSKRFDLTRPGEWEMAVKIAGAPDFIGGFEHGDEWETSVQYFIDGEEVDITAITELTDFNQIIVKSVSNMYDPNDHSTLVGIHGKKWVFEDGKATLYQSVQWLFAESTNMSASFLTMLPTIRGNDTISAEQITDHYYDDVNFTARDCGVYGFDGNMSKLTKSMTVYGVASGFHANVEVLEYPDYPNSKYNYLSNGENKANKMYFGVCGYGTTTGVVSPGDVWKSKSIFDLTMANGST